MRYSAAIATLILLVCVAAPTAQAAIPFLQIEWSSVNITCELWTQVNTTNLYLNPIVVASPEYTATTLDNGIGTWITNVTSNSFLVKNSDENFACQDDVFVHYIVMEEGNYTLPGGQKIEAGRVSTSKVGFAGTNWLCPTFGEYVSFSDSFTGTPLVFSTRVTEENVGQWAVTFQHANESTAQVGTDTMCIGLNRNRIGNAGAFTVDETIHWIAVDEGNGTLGGQEYEVLWNLDDTGNSGDSWINGFDDGIPFSESYSHTWSGVPRVIPVSITSVQGTDGSWAVLYDTGNTADLRMFVDETNDRAHTGSESGGGWAFNTSGNFSLNENPEVTDAQFNDSVIYRLGTILFNVTVSDPNGNDTLREVNISLVLPSGSIVNTSLERTFILSSANSGDLEPNESQLIAQALFSTNPTAQTGRLEITGVNASVTLNHTYNVSKSFIIRRYATLNSDSQAEPDGATANIRFTNCTGALCNQLIAERYVGVDEDAIATYSLLEADNIQVWNFSLNWASGEGNVTFTPSPSLPPNFDTSCFVNAHRTIRLNTATVTDFAEAEVRSNISSANTVFFTRDGEDGGAAAEGISYGEVVCFRDNTTIQEIFFTMGESEPRTDNVAISAVNLTYAWVVHNHQQPDDGVGQNAIIANLTNATNLELTYTETGQTAAGDQPQTTTYVIEHEEGSMATVENIRISPGSTDQDITSVVASKDLSRTLLNCYNTMSAGGGTAHTRDYWVHYFVDDSTISSINYRTRGGSQVTLVNCWAIEWPLLTTFNTGIGDTSTDFITYEDVDGMLGEIVANITIRINITSYNNSASLALGNNAPDLSLELATGSMSYANVGTLSITGPGLYELNVTDSQVRTAWVDVANRDLRIRAINMDVNGSLRDAINWSFVDVNISLQNTTPTWSRVLNLSSFFGIYNLSSVTAFDVNGGVNHSLFSTVFYRVVPRPIIAFTLTLPGQPPTGASVTGDNFTSSMLFNATASSQKDVEPCVFNTAFCQNETVPFFSFINTGNQNLTLAFYLDEVLPPVFNLTTANVSNASLAQAVTNQTLFIQNHLLPNTTHNQWAYGTFINALVTDSVMRNLTANGSQI